MERENENYFLIINIINCMHFLIITIINYLQKIGEDQDIVGRENELLYLP